MDLKNAVAERKAESRTALLSERTKVLIADMKRAVSEGKGDPKAAETQIALLTGELSKKDYVESIRKHNDSERRKTDTRNLAFVKSKGVKSAQVRVAEMNKTFFSERPEKLVFDEKRDIVTFVNGDKETVILSDVARMAGKMGISENVIRAELKKIKVEV